MPTTVGPPQDDDYKQLVDAIVQGECVPFLGAGANLCGHNPQDWDPEHPSVLPLGGQLAGWLAKEFGYPLGESNVICHCHNEGHKVVEKPEDLLRISQYVVLERKKGPLVNRLRNLLDQDYPPTMLHRLLAAIPAHLRAAGKSPHLLVITTNYDDLMERALVEAGEKVDVIYYVPVRTERGRRIEGTFVHRKQTGETTPLAGDGSGISLDSASIVFKIHGTVERNLTRSAVGADTYVITEDDYIDYLTRIDLVFPAAVMAKVGRSSFLFLGYGLRDWNLRAFLNRIWMAQPAAFQSWAFQFNPDQLEARFWEDREVKVFSEDLSKVVQELSTRLQIALPAQGTVQATP